MATWTMPAFSTRNSTLPALISRTALPMSKVTVPTLGLGMRPRGPRIFPRRPTTPIMSGVAIAVSKSSHCCSWIFLASSSAPTWSAPAASAAGRALDRLDRLLQAGRRQVGHLDARDLLDLLAGHLPHLLLPRLAGALLDPRRALQEHRRRRRLGDEGEGAVGVDRDHDRDDEARLRLRLGIERLAELHDVDAALAEGRPDRRARGR